MRIECVPRESSRRVSHAPLKGRLIESPRKLPWRQKEVIRARNFPGTSQTRRKIPNRDRLKMIGFTLDAGHCVVKEINNTGALKEGKVASARKL